jgi:hypothetical protein
MIQTAPTVGRGFFPIKPLWYRPGSEQEGVRTDENERHGMEAPVANRRERIARSSRPLRSGRLSLNRYRVSFISGDFAPMILPSTNLRKFCIPSRNGAGSRSASL